MQTDKVILIAEDDLGQYLLTQRCILRAGIENEMVGFQDGAELLEYLDECLNSGHHNSGDFILLLDLNMPKVDGLEVLKRIKQSCQLKDIHVIVLTASNNIDDVKHCLAYNCDDYVVKPADDKLIEAIREADNKLIEAITEADNVSRQQKWHRLRDLVSGRL